VNSRSWPGADGARRTYDDNGNLAFDGRFHYYYDCDNRLIDVNDDANARVASYAYDYLGRRISKTVYGTPNVTTRYAYDGDRIIAEYNGAGTLRRKFIYGPGIDEPIYLIDVANGNAVYYYHFDGLGSVVALSDVNNVLVERYAYDVFGRPTIRDPNGVVLAASAWGNPYLFTGRAYDGESGLYYYRARYYDHATGRFLQPDPAGYGDGLNLHSYCGNNPIGFVDPWGLAHHDKRETQRIIDKGKTEFYIPLKHRLLYPEGYDFGYSPLTGNDTFELQDGTIMDATEFGNYYAGYMGTYHMGDPGYIAMRMVGNVMENDRNPDLHGLRRYNPFSGDDYKSIRDLRRGNVDGQRAKYQDYKGTLIAIKDIIKDLWSRLKDSK
jgi:RHS repeat-associated protein